MYVVRWLAVASLLVLPGMQDAVASPSECIAPWSQSGLLSCSNTGTSPPECTCFNLPAVAAEVLAGGSAGIAALQSLTGLDVVPPLVALNTDANDGASCSSGGLSGVLTDEQEALLGCGPLWGTDCDADGIDLLNAEASVLIQSFIGFGGNYSPDYAANNFTGWFYGKTDANGNAYSQPGTVGFDGAPVGLHDDNGQIIQVFGSRGPGDPGYNPNVDGTVSFVGSNLGQCAGQAVLGIPCTSLTGAPLANGGYGASAGQLFTSEMAALSFNMQMLLVAFSTNASDLEIEQTELNPGDPFSAAPGQCSFLQPQFCSNVIALLPEPEASLGAWVAMGVTVSLAARRKRAAR